MNIRLHYVSHYHWDVKLQLVKQVNFSTIEFNSQQSVHCVEKFIQQQHKNGVIVIVNSRFSQRPQKRSRGNQHIHRRLTKTKSIDRESRSRE